MHIDCRLVLKFRCYGRFTSFSLFFLFQVYILPGLFYIKAVPGPTFSRKKLPAVLLVVLGCVLVPLCLVMWVFRYVICTGEHNGEPMCITLGITVHPNDHSSTTTATSHFVG